MLSHRFSFRTGALFMLVAAASIALSAPQDEAADKSKEVNDPASLLRRLDLEFNFVDSKAIGTISTFAPAITIPVSQRGKFKVILPLTGSSLSRNLELGDLALSYVHIPFQSPSQSVILGLRADLNTGAPSRGTGAGVTTLSPTIGAVYNRLVPGALVAPLLQYKTTIGSPRDGQDVGLGTFKLIYVKFLPQGSWLRLQPTINVDFERNDSTTGLFLVQYGKLLSPNVSASIGYDFNVYGPKGGDGAFQVSIGYLF